MTFRGSAKERDHRFGDGASDARHVVDLLGRGLHERRHRPEPAGEQLGHRLADVADAETEEQRRERPRLRRLDGGDELLRRLLGEPVQLHQLLGGELVQVRHVGDVARCSRSWRTRS